jgi:hypothetical protein
MVHQKVLNAVEKSRIVGVTSVVTDNHQTLRYGRTKSVFSGSLLVIRWITI